MNTKLLDDLHEMRCAVDALRMQRDQFIDDVLTEKQKQEIDDIKAEFKDKIFYAEERCAELEAEIRNAAKEHGETVKGKYITAMVMKPKVKWDSEGLMAMAKHDNYKWLLQFVELSEPAVQIRTR